VLAQALDEMQRLIGVRPSCTLDQQKAALDIIVPKFTLKPRLEHFVAGGRHDERTEMLASIGRVWRKIRTEHPELWSYDAWYTAKMQTVDTRELSVDDFAERMRRKRDVRASEEEEAATPEEESGAQEAAGEEDVK